MAITMAATLAAFGATSSFQGQLLPNVPVCTLINAPAMSLPDSRVEIPEAIVDEPAGKHIQMARSGLQFINLYGSLSVTPIENGVANLTVADNGDVYLANYITCMPVYFNIWVKGHLEGDKVSMTFPQYAAAQGVGPDGQPQFFTVYALDDTYNTDDPKIPAVSENQTVTFTYKDGVLTQDDDRIVGVCVERPDGTLAFMGYGDSQAVFTPFTQMPQVEPDGVTPEKWAMVCGNSGNFVYMTFVGDDVYIRGMSPNNLPEAVVKGTIQGDKIVIERDQYMGIYTDPYSYEYYAYAIPVKATPYTDEYGDEMAYEFMDKLVMSYDKEGRSIKAEENEGFCLNSGKTNLSVIDMYLNPHIFYQASYGQPMAPADPCDLVLMELPEDAWDSYGFAEFSFDVPLLSTNGDLLDVNNLYYNIYIDEDEVYTFDPSVYEHIDEVMTDIPATFTEYWDFHVQNDTHHIMYLWFTGYGRIGVQSVYKVGDDVRRSSIVYNDGTIGIADNTVTRNDAPATYYDLLGRRVANPANGVFIVKQGAKTYKVKL